MSEEVHSIIPVKELCKIAIDRILPQERLQPYLLLGRDRVVPAAASRLSLCKITEMVHI